MTTPDSFTFTISEASPSRLDVAVQEAAKARDLALSRSQASKLIQSGKVRVNDAVTTRPAAVAVAGSLVRVKLQQEESELSPFDFPLDILHVDHAFLVINKPANLTMHPGAGNKTRTLANAVVSYLQDAPEDFAGGVRPGIVHRLDRDTTGVVVVARTVAAHGHLSEQFARRSTERSYQALVAVTPRANREVQRTSSGSIETQLGRHPTRRKQQAVVQAGGRRACTHWEREELFSYAALLRLRLETGRTHQIRVHMEHIRSPVIGDRTYGQVDFLPPALQRLVESFGRQALHAASLAFDHPITGKRLFFKSPLPDDMQNLVQAFRGYSDEHG